MKEQRYLVLTFTSMILSILMALTGRFISEKNINKNIVNTRTIDFEIPLPEPIIIEKEVIIYVEKEIVVEEQKHLNLQPINGNFNIMEPSNLTREELILALEDLRGGLHSSVDAIIEAEKVYGVNALYLASVLGYESGWGKYEKGINNIAGWKGDNGNFSNFNSRYECIMEAAEGLSTYFVEDVGTRVSDVAVLYCPDYGYLDTLLQIMGELDYNLRGIY